MRIANRFVPKNGEQPSRKRLSLFSPDAVEFWWARVPARLDRYSALLSVAWSDGIYLVSWPRIAMLLPLTALIFGFVEGVSHFKFLSIMDVGISFAPAAVFAQSLPLVIIAAFVGSLSANAGLMMVLGYALGDFLWGGVPWTYGFPHSVLSGLLHLRVPELATYVLFFLLAVMPIVSTNYLLAGLYRRLPGRDRRVTLVRIGAMAVVQALFLYEWTFIAPMVIHPMWSWRGSGSPVTIAFFHRVTTPWIVGAALAAVVTRGWLTSRAQSNPSFATQIQRLDDAAADAADDGLGFFERRPWLQAALATALITLLALGFLPSPLMAAETMGLVAAILLARAYLLPQLSVWKKWGALVDKIPLIFRLGAVVFATY